MEALNNALPMPDLHCEAAISFANPCNLPEVSLDVLFASGTYGTMKVRIGNQLKQIAGEEGSIGSAKRKYIKDRIFPSQEVVQRFFPFFYKHIWARPFLPVFRLIRGVIFRRKKIMLELKILSR